MPDEEAEGAVTALARAAGLDLDPQLLEETAAGWRLMAPHLQTVRGVELPPHAEPASLFRP